MKLAIIGCGYVAEFYGKTLGNYAALELAGAYDANADNLAKFCARWGTRAYASLDDLLADPAVELVVNLTNPRAHYAISKRCLEAGKHVYSEKPLAMDAAAARELAELAAARGLYLAAAPCSMLNETAQTLWHALRGNAIGRVRLVYANFDDGMIAPALSPWQWRNESGVPWPAKDEFEVGCTYEHAGYFLTWLAAFFGPALRATSFSACLVPQKGIAVETMAPDFVSACLEYADGVVARVTCSLVAPLDKSLTIVGDDGVLMVPDLRNDICPIYWRAIPARGFRAGIERRVNGWRRALKLPGAERDWHWWRRYPPQRQGSSQLVSAGKPVDFCRGLAEMVSAIEERRPSRLSADLACHIVELVERLQYPERFAGRPDVASRFAPIAPLP
jgi:predicted dehydrogenase